MKIGVICPSEVAYRRFMPALKKCDFFEYAGVACASKEEWSNNTKLSNKKYEELNKDNHDKANEFVKNYGGIIFNSYKKLINNKEIEAIYIPLPPALHYKWAMEALKKGKHVLIEKPSTLSYKESKKLVDYASKHNLTLHENYMFVYHSQINEINKQIKNGIIGDTRLYRVDFGFPMRGKNDFRYISDMGGGALYDCGGYTLKYANLLLGESTKIISANLGYKKGFDVDIYGSATLTNNRNECVQVSFGMDNDYRCDINVWGSKGTLTSNRILTAPVGFVPKYEILKNGTVEKFVLEEDDTFYKSIENFKKCIRNKKERENNYKDILKQALLVDEFKKLVNK